MEMESCPLCLECPKLREQIEKLTSEKNEHLQKIKKLTETVEELERKVKSIRRPNETSTSDDHPSGSPPEASKTNLQEVQEENFQTKQREDDAVVENGLLALGLEQEMGSAAPEGDELLGGGERKGKERGVAPLSGSEDDDNTSLAAILKKNVSHHKKASPPKKKAKSLLKIKISKTVTSKKSKKTLSGPRRRKGKGREKDASSEGEEETSGLGLTPDTTNTLIQCNVCSQKDKEVFVSPNRFLTHLLSQHKDVDLFPCSQCRRTFKYPRSMVKHWKLHFVDPSQRNLNRRCSERPKFGEWYCIECRRHFATKETFKSHQLIHSGEKPFPCQHCDRRFRQRGTMIRHVQVKHGGEMHKECPECKAKFPTNADLVRHKRRHHEKEKPFPCDSCDQRFFEKHLLYAHRRARHLSMYKCQVCHKELADIYQLKVHTKRVHLKERPYPCHCCDRYFGCRKNLKAHYKTHPDVSSEEVELVISQLKTPSRLEHEKESVQIPKMCIIDNSSETPTSRQNSIENGKTPTKRGKNSQSHSKDSDVIYDLRPVERPPTHDDSEVIEREQQGSNPFNISMPHCEIGPPLVYQPQYSQFPLMNW